MATITATEILAQVSKGPNNSLAWLPEDSTLETIAESLVAMANCVGGLLVVGIEEGEITGISQPQKSTDLLIEASLAADPPLIIPLPQALTLDDKTIVITQIPSGMPHVYAFSGRYLTRKNNANVPLTPRDLRRLMIERGEMTFETNIAQGATLDDIDWQKAREYAENLIGFSQADAQQVLLRRGCLIARGTDILPTNAGLLLFGKDPQRFLIGSDISALRFGGEEMSDNFTRQDISGTLPDQIKRTETFLIDHMRKDVALTALMAREETYEYPMEAARELVVNAVAHRDYSLRGDNIRVFIFSNRMEVYSPGTLPGPVTVENIRDERFSRNPIIVQVLADLQFIEKLGYGVDRVMELMRAQNFQEPEFEERAGGFRVILRKLDTPQARLLTALAVAKNGLGGTYEGHEINERQEAAIVYLLTDASSRITNSDLKEMFSDVHPETIRRDLADLVNKKILKKLGQKRGSYYVLQGQDAGA